jgi:hypothetical protein
LNFIDWHQGGASALCNWSKQIGYTMQNAARVKKPTANNPARPLLSLAGTPNVAWQV